MVKKKGQKIKGQFVPMIYPMLKSEAFKSLSTTAKVTYLYFEMDRKIGHQTEFILTFYQAQKYGVCASPATFNKVKRELVVKGFLDPFEPGGLNQPAIFELSNRWKWYGTDRFQKVEYQPGVGSKYFRQAWKEKELSERLIKARHRKKPNTDSV